MKLTPYQKEVYSGAICPYCKSKTKVVSEEHIYGRSYKGKSMICCINFPNCDSYVGTHEKDGTALGRLANNQLRQLKKVTHSWFDRIWREKHMSRNEAYEWLSEEINIPLDYCHIGMMNINSCKKAIQACIKYFKNE